MSIVIINNTERNKPMLYIWICEEDEWAPYMSYEASEKEEALFELDDLKASGYEADFGPSFD